MKKVMDVSMIRAGRGGRGRVAAKVRWLLKEEGVEEEEAMAREKGSEEGGRRRL